MICVGMDLSYTRTGIAVVESSTTDGFLQEIELRDSLTFKFPPQQHRLAKVYATISSEFVAARHPHFDKANLYVIEDPIYGVFGRNRGIIPTASIKLAELAAIFKLFLEVRNRPYLTVSPTAVKKFITGRGDAEKVQVAAEINRRFSIKFERDPGNDLSDATSLALWGLVTKGS